MNKRRIDDWIPVAYEALDKEIAENGKINKTYRGAISAFGAAIAMGSLLSAVSFFNTEEKGTINRKKILNLVLTVLRSKEDIKEKSLFDYVRNHNDYIVKEKIMDAAVALKLAMNLFELVES